MNTNSIIVKIFEQNGIRSKSGKLKNQGLLLDFLMNIIEQCEDSETVMTAMIMLERVCSREVLNCRDRKELLREVLRKHSMFITHFDLLNVRSLLDFNSVQYQVDWCARWFVDNLDSLSDGEDEVFKLSADRLSVRNDTRYMPTVLSMFPVQVGVFYYEVVLVTNGKIRVGWTTWESRLSQWNGLGEDPYSVGFDGSQEEGVIWHACSCGNLKHPIGESDRIVREREFGFSEIPKTQISDIQSPEPTFLRKKRPPPLNLRSKWNCGDVVGALLDLTRHQFTFYLNGNLISTQLSPHFSTQPYYAAVSLSTHQQVQFNFGQTPFRFPPEPHDVQSFHSASQGDERRYRLRETSLIKEYNPLGYYWFKREIIDSAIDGLFFRDQTQHKYDELITQLQQDIEQNQKTSTNLLNSQKIFELNCLRFIQSLLEVFTLKLNETDPSFRPLLETIQKLLNKNQSNSFEHIKLCELLYPYVQLPANESNLVKCHNTLLLIGQFFRVNEHFQNILTNKRQQKTLRNFIVKSDNNKAT